MKTANNLVKLVLLSVAFSACVPLQRFQDTQDKLNTCQTELDENKQKSEQLGVENTEMKQVIEKNRLQLNNLVKDSMNRMLVIDTLRAQVSNLQLQVAELQNTQESILKGNAKETSRLLKQLQATQEDLKKREAALQKAFQELEEKKNSLNVLNAEITRRNVRLKELENILFRKDSVVNALKAKVSAALLGFEGEGLTVKVNNGKVYVSMQDKLLFKSASTEVDKKGQDAIKKLAKVLEQNPDINVTIEGHTDNVPYKSDERIKDNWDLSVQRATAIVRIIINNSDVAPKRLTASGRGEFSPVGSNKTAEGRAQNRRTEIILTPKLDELFKILESN
ncbi:MAG TPA: OmpA family protein [Bacteroidales bacterium]|nr:OmpA family protein [Bacteroidales bacterium]